LQRYKLLCPQTWPNYRGSDQDGARQICNQYRLVTARSAPADHDVAFGKTKLL